MLHITRQGQTPQEVTQVVSQSEQLRPRLIILESATGELSPFHRVFPSLIHCSGGVAPVVELNDVCAPLVQVGHDKTDARTTHPGSILPWLLRDAADPSISPGIGSCDKTLRVYKKGDPRDASEDERFPAPEQHWL